MSGRRPAVVAAMEDAAPKLRGSRLLVLVAVAASSRPDGTGAWPSIATLARRTRLSERAVRWHISELVNLGELERHRKRGPRGTNAYTVTAAARQEADEREEVTPGRPLDADEEVSPGRPLAPAPAADPVSPGRPLDGGSAPGQLAAASGQIGAPSWSPRATAEHPLQASLEASVRETAPVKKAGAAEGGAARRLRQLDCDPDHECAVALLDEFGDEDVALALDLVARRRGSTSAARGPRAVRLARFLLDAERSRGTLDEWRAYERGRAA